MEGGHMPRPSCEAVESRRVVKRCHNPSLLTNKAHRLKATRWAVLPLPSCEATYLSLSAACRGHHYPPHTCGTGSRLTQLLS